MRPEQRKMVVARGSGGRIADVSARPLGDAKIRQTVSLAVVLGGERALVFSLTAGPSKSDLFPLQRHVQRGKGAAMLTTRTRSRKLETIVTAVIGACAIVAVTSGAPLAASKCSGGKIKAAGKKASTKLGCLAKGISKGIG